jgi:SAM-dependent methyltransferase
MTAARADAVIWHDVECAGYEADLPLWRELAESARGPVLEIGCGTGRVALDLAARGHDVAAIDSEPAFVRELERRARERGLSVDIAIGDVRSPSLERDFALAIAPMQVVQLLGGVSGRAAMLDSVRSMLSPKGRLAIAIADPFEGMAAEEAGPPVPDVRERDGWVFSSVPFSVRPQAGGTAIDRLRQTVSPDGELDESMATVVLDSLDAEQMEREASEHGFAALPRREIPAAGDYVGSVVAILERG